MADIVLVQPAGHRFDLVSKRTPLGLLYAANLPSKAGYSVKIIDMKLAPDWKRALNDSIGPETLCVGITCSTGVIINSAVKVAKHVRSVAPEVPIVWGGPHPTHLPAQTLKHPLVDMVVVNEGDRSFLELVETLAHKGNLRDVKGIGFKKDGEVVVNPPAPLIKDLDSLPIVPYRLIDVASYSSMTRGRLPSIDMVTSRGCPNNCAFCSIPSVSNGHWRALSADRIIEEIVFLQREYGKKVFYFTDDNFMADPKRVEAFLDALKANGLNIFWGTQGVTVRTINAMSGKMLDRIEESGCIELSIGVESADDEILKAMNKKITVNDTLAANDKLAGRDIAIKYTLIIGFPGETMTGIRKTVALALELYRKNKKVWFPINIYTPQPGTALLEKAKEYGFNPPADLESWSNLERTGWSRHYTHWLGARENDLVESINFTGYFAFPAAAHRVTNPVLKALFRLYGPVALYRFKHEFYSMHVEKQLFNSLFGFFAG